jgi:hypothetical protein
MLNDQLAAAQHCLGKLAAMGSVLDLLQCYTASQPASEMQQHCNLARKQSKERQSHATAAKSH